MDGWMYRFKGGFADGKTCGPIHREPPEEIDVVDIGDGDFAYVVSDGGQHDDDVARYRRVRMSKLTDEQLEAMPVLVRGAEYEAVR